MLRHYMKCRGELEDWDEHMPGPDIIARYSKTSNRWYIGLYCRDTQTATAMSWLRFSLGFKSAFRTGVYFGHHIIGEYPEHFLYYCNKTSYRGRGYPNLNLKCMKYILERNMSYDQEGDYHLSVSLFRDLTRGLRTALLPDFNFWLRAQQEAKTKMTPRRSIFTKLSKGTVLNQCRLYTLLIL